MSTRFFRNSILFLALLGGVFPAATYAQDTSKYVRPPGTVDNQFIYERTTMSKISQLYWALNKFSIEDNKAVDNYMLINECEIYQNYIQNEFEWQNIRESGRKYIKKNMKEFSTRFEVEQPIYFSEYDFDEGVFEVWEPFKIDGIKLFEVKSQEHDNQICGVREGMPIEGYPRAIITELARPLSVTHVKMDEDVARQFVTMKSEMAGEPHDERAVHNKRWLYESRSAYLVLKVKYFSYKAEESVAKGAPPRARLLGALEGLEIYADRNHKFPLYQETFRQSAGQKKAEKALRARVEARKEKKRKEEAAERNKDKAGTF